MPHLSCYLYFIILMEPNVEGLINYNDIDALQEEEHRKIMEAENLKRAALR